MTAKKRVLIVDDEPGLREVLADRFSKDGWETATANDGVEALAKGRSEEFHLILLDLLMPNMDGITFLRHAKDDDKLKTIPVIVLTVSASGDDIKKVIELGAKDYFVKSHDSIDKILAQANTYVP